LVDGERKLVQFDYLDPDWPDGYDYYRSKLEETILSEGVAFGAFETSGRMVAFATLDHDFFGEKAKHLLLDSMFVSRECRGKGIGKRLFRMCAEQAKEWGADKLYMCAGSAEDTIAFYHSLGCTDAEEIDQALFEEDPRDIQLEYILK